MRRLVAVITFSFALLVAASAQASCFEFSDFNEIEAPKTAAAGHTLHLVIDNDAPDAVLTVEAADPAKPISHPYTRSGLPQDPFDAAVETERGDGPVRVRLDWTETYYTREPCAFQNAKTINLVVATTKTQIRVRKGYDDNDYDDNLNINLLGGARCLLLVSPLPASVTVTGAAGSFTQSFRDVCTRKSARKRVRGRPPFRLAVEGTGHLVFRPSSAKRRSWDRRYRYTIKIAGRVRETGVISDLAEYYPGHKVWAGTDEYWNYCVNHGETVYAENGNYYCWNSAFQYRELKFKRRPR